MLFSISLERHLNYCWVKTSCLTVIHFSDGAPTQYKNRIGFVDCSHSAKDHGIQFERHLFGSRHGKGPCERDIGVIKESINRAVAAGQAHVSLPRDLFNVWGKHLIPPRQGTQHSLTKWRFLFVDTGNISRDTPNQTQTKPPPHPPPPNNNNNKQANKQTTTNTRKCTASRDFNHLLLFSARERSSFCSGCRGDDAYAYSDVFGQWTVT